MNLCAQRMKEKLESKKLKFEYKTINDDKSLIQFPFEGKVAQMYFSGNNGTYLSMRCLSAFPRRKSPM